MDYFAVGVMAYECMFGKVSNIILLTLCRDLMLGNLDRRSEITYSRSRFRLRRMKYLKVGHWRLLTLSTR